MDSKWNVRLKKCRESSNFSMRDLASLSMLDVSPQSLIKYEKGEVYPRIDILEKMCHFYNTTIDYILYGDNTLLKYDSRADTLLVIFLLMYSEKIVYSENEETLLIKDKKLIQQIKTLALFKDYKEISSISDMNTLIEGIKKLAEN